MVAQGDGSWVQVDDDGYKQTNCANLDHPYKKSVLLHVHAERAHVSTRV